MALVSCLAVFIHLGKQSFPMISEKVQIFCAMGWLALYGTICRYGWWCKNFRGIMEVEARYENM